MVSIKASIAIALSLAGTGLRAQAAPPEGLAAGVEFDQARGALLVAGGDGGDGSLGTWLWDGSSWRKDSGPGPSPREEPLLAWDSDARRIILHGGLRGREPPANDTWEWNGQVWRELPGDGPPARLAGQMVYDSHRHRVVLFGGGKPGGGEFNDTWEWDGQRWTELSPDGAAGSPPARVLFGLAYDATRRRVVLFGGTQFVDGKPVPRADTWEWDGSVWREIKTTGPSARDHVWAVYSPVAKAVLLHSGGSPEHGLVNDTWKYDGKSWTPISQEGPARARHRLVFDEKGKRMLLFGGWTRETPGVRQRRLSDLWSFDGKAWTLLVKSPEKAN